METKNLTIGERIRYRRKNLEHTQRSLVKALKISHVSVSQWGRGDSEPTGKNLFALSKVLQCSPTWTLFSDEDKQPTPPAEKPVVLSPKELELLELFDALPESERDTQLAEMWARVKNLNKFFGELLKAHQRTNKG